MDKQFPIEEIRSISRQFQSMTTLDPNLNINEQQQSPNDTSSTMPRIKNSTSLNSMNEKKKKSCLLDDNWSFKDLPGTNLPERILFVVDTAQELNCTPFETRAGGKFTPLSMIKRIIEIFINVKSGIHKDHEYALIALKADDATWIGDFTNNRKTFMSYLEKIHEDPIEDSQDIYNLGPCFEAICANADMEENAYPPTNVARVILVYSRSRAIPMFTTGRHFFDRLVKNSHFYVDSLYVHEPLGDNNDCQNIYAQLGKLDTNQTSYILEVGRNAATLHTNMAKLLAHPLQRAKQDDSPYTFYNPSNQDHHTNS